MAIDETVGSIGVDISADYSGLLSAIDEATQASEKGAQSIAEAFNIPEAGQPLIRSFDELVAKASDIQDAFQKSLSTFNDVQTAFNNGEVSAGTLDLALKQLEESATAAGVSLKQAGEKSHEAGEGFGSLVAEGLKIFGVVFTLEKLAEGLKEIVIGSIEAFAEFQRAEIALTAMMGSAEKATETLESLKGLAMSDALSFPSLVQATQRMTAFGIATEDIPGALQAAADAAAATGNAFDAVAGAMERMALSGNAGTRQLVQLGLSTQDLARAMNISAASVKDAFKEMDPTERVQVIVDALQKFSGVAEKEAESISGQWQKLKNVAHFTFEDIGKSFEGMASSFTAAASAVLAKTDELIKKYGELQKQKNIQLETQAEMNRMELGEAIGLDAAAAAIKRMNDANIQLNENTKSLGSAMLALSPAVSEAEKKHTAAAEAVKELTAALGEEKARIDAGRGSSAAYVILLNQLAEAQDKATPKIKGAADAIKKLSEAMDKLGMADLGKKTADLNSAFTLLSKSGKLSGDQVTTAFANLQLKLLELKATAESEPLKALGVKKTSDELAVLALAIRQAKTELDAGKISAGDFGAALNSFTAKRAEIMQLEEAFSSMGREMLLLGGDSAEFERALQAIAATHLPLSMVAMDVSKLGPDLLVVGDAAYTAGKAMAAAGIESKEAIGQEIEALARLIDQMRLARATEESWTSVQEADFNTLLHELKKLQDEYDVYGTTIVNVKHKTDIWTKEFESAIKSISDEFGRLIVQGGNFGDAMLKIVESIAAKIISVLVQAAFGSLLKALGSTITQMGTLQGLFHDIFGGVAQTVGGPGGTSGFAGAVTGLGGAASSAGGAAAGASSAVSGVWGIVGAIGSIGTMISSIIGNFQQAHMNKVLGQIEENTRYSSIIAQQLKPIFEQYIPMLGVLTGATSGGGVNNMMGNDHADLVNIANILTTMLTVMRIPNIAGGVLKPGLYSESQTTPAASAGITVNMYVTSNDPTNIARKLATMLRGRGVIFTPA